MSEKMLSLAKRAQDFQSSGSWLGFGSFWGASDSSPGGEDLMEAKTSALTLIHNIRPDLHMALEQLKRWVGVAQVG
jgi:hypothetical protein